jgi:Ca-activated chloride channel family protein
MSTPYHLYLCRLRRTNRKHLKNGHAKTINIIRKILVVISIYLVFGILFNSVYANTEIQNKQRIDPYQAKHGSVWILPDNGVYIEVLQMQTDVDYKITGAIARATVKQSFKNTSEFYAEGIYVFPLPEKAAVDQFRMIIGDRIIEGQVKERIEAKKIYETAKAAGKKTGLIEQQRPNVFTTLLANIAPGENIIIEFSYQQVLDYKDAAYRLRFPMVVGPRYHPAINSNKKLPTQQNNVDSGTNVYTQTDPVKTTNNPTRIHILLDTGANLSELKSSYHRIDIKQTSENRYSISTIGENIRSDRDFELVWKPQLTDSPQLSTFQETTFHKFGADDNYALITLLPPALSHLQQKVQARDVVFVLDISGSMSGTSIEQAKASLIIALDGLSAIDRFNIIWFNHEAGSLFPDAVVASDRNKNLAKRYIDNLQASGGTEMLAALNMALSPQQEFTRFRQIVFLTDGNISNEAALFDVINRKLGDNRLFTIGIGSAPNAYFMRRAANIGRGTFTYIGDVNEVKQKTISLFNKLETPALINIQLDIDRDEYEVYPNIIPDLYAGETSTILVKGSQLPDIISIKGDYGNIEWQHSSAMVKSTPIHSNLVHSSSRSSTKGIRIAWAREKIASLMSLRHTATAENEREVIKQKITDTALEHHLVSRYTSLVAVDVTPVNIDTLLLRQRMKNNLPNGWKLPATNGLLLAQTATGLKTKLLLGLVSLLAALLLYRRRSANTASCRVYKHRYLS